MVYSEWREEASENLWQEDQYYWAVSTSVVLTSWRRAVGRQRLSRKRNIPRTRIRRRMLNSSTSTESQKKNMAVKDFFNSSGTGRLESSLAGLEWVGVSQTPLIRVHWIYNLEYICSEDHCLLHHLLLIPYCLLHADAVCLLCNSRWHEAMLGHWQQWHHWQEPWSWLQTHATWWEVSG